MGPSVLFSSLVILNRIKNNGIGDAGNTADFRMLFEMFEIFDFLKCWIFLSLLNYFKIVKKLELFETFEKI